MKGTWTYQYGEVYAENGDVIARRDVEHSPNTSPVERDEMLRAMSASPELIAVLRAIKADFDGWNLLTDSVKAEIDAALLKAGVE